MIAEFGPLRHVASRVCMCRGLTKTVDDELDDVKDEDDEEDLPEAQAPGKKRQ